MNPSRRSIITGLVSFIAAPAIVRASSLMPVKASRLDWLAGTVVFDGFVQVQKQTDIVLFIDQYHTEFSALFETEPQKDTNR